MSSPFHSLRTPFSLLTDTIGSVVNIVIWSIAELGSAISLSSIPSIRPLYAHVFKKGANKGSPAGSGGAGTKRGKKSGPSHLPFSLNTIGSIADKSAWKNQVQMFSLKSKNDDQEQSQIAKQSSESQDHIVSPDAKSQPIMVRTSVSIEKHDIAELRAAYARK